MTDLRLRCRHGRDQGGRKIADHPAVGKTGIISARADRRMHAGIATCACGHRWMQTRAEIERERQHQQAYDRMCEQWEREQRSVFRRTLRWVRSLWNRPARTQDEIPF